MGGGCDQSGACGTRKKRILEGMARPQTLFLKCPPSENKVFKFGEASFEEQLAACEEHARPAQEHEAHEAPEGEVGAVPALVHAHLAQRAPRAKNERVR